MNKKKFISITVILVILISSFQLGFAVDLDNLTKYDIDITLNTEKHTVEGTQTISIINSYDTELNDLVFHLYADAYKSKETLPSIGEMYYWGDHEDGELTEEQKGYINIKKVYINNVNTKYTDKNQILKINMDKPLKKGEKVDIKIEFTLKIPEGNHRLHYNEGTYSLTNWYPVLSIYSEKDRKWNENPYHPIGESNYSNVSNYNVKLTIPKDMVASPTGTIIEEKENKENKTITIKAEKVRDFVIFMSNQYEVKTKEVDGIKISNYSILEEGAKDNKTADMILDEVAKTIKFMNKTVGKYPYDELRIAETYLSGGAMEYPQAIQMGRYWGVEDEDITESAPFTIEAAVHETMHQWWYVGVGNNEFKEPFLDESLTVFSTAYYFEKEYGKKHDNGVDFAIRNSIYPNKIPSLDSNVGEFSGWGDYGQTIYNRGPAFFESLRRKVGEEKFIKILKTYYERYQFKNATIDDLLEIIEEISGKEVKDNMKDAVTDPNYYPKEIALTEDEENAYNRNMTKRHIKREERQNGLIRGSIILRALEGESIIVVKSDLNEDDLPIFEEFTQALKDYEMKDTKIEIKEEKDLTEEDKKGNLILIGYLNKNSVMEEIKSDIPIKMDEDTISIDGVTIKNKNTTGTFIIENPNNKENLILVIFLDENINKEYSVDENLPYRYIPIYNYESQFIINTNEIQIQGKYDTNK